MVKRYVLTEYPHETCMEESDFGQYVLYDDYSALEARVAGLESELKDEGSDIETLSAHNIELQNKMAELEKDSNAVASANDEGNFMTEGDKERYRVQAAIAAMQAIIGKNPLVTGNVGDGLIERAAKRVAAGSVIYADALMKELGIEVKNV